jgi:hypothetical protein
MMHIYFDDNPMFGEDEEGQPIFFDWLRVEDSAPVRVQVRESYAKSRWRIAWTDDEAIKLAFNNIKGEHVTAALKAAAPLGGRDYRVYTLE